MAGPVEVTSTMGSSPGRGDDGDRSVLVVEDEPELLEIYSGWLENRYRVRSAGSAQTAYRLMDESIDVVLLDRMMPEVSGDEVLATFREAGYDCKVGMVTAVEPDLDVADLGFDEYVRKPVSEEELNELVSRLLQRRSFDEGVQEYFAVISTLVTLDQAEDDLADSERYRELVERKQSLRAELDVTSESFDREDFDATMREFGEFGTWAE